MDKLPDEVLIVIFSYLDNDSVITAYDVCRRWQNVIRESSSLVKRFCLQILIRTNTIELLDTLQGANYQKAILSEEDCQQGHKSIPKKLKKKLAQYEESVKELTCESLRSSILIHSLNFFQFMTKLILVDVNHTKFDTKVKLPNLMRLEIFNSDFCLNLIESKNLKFFKIYGSNENNLNFQNTFDNFLENCKNSLNELKVLNNSSLINFNVKLKLEKLFLEKIHVDDENLLNFLKSQKEFLKILSLFEINEVSKSFKFILTEMKIKIFTTAACLIPNDLKSFLSNFKNLNIENLTVKNLENVAKLQANFNQHPGQFNVIPEISLTFDNFKKTETLLSILPNVKNLKIYDYGAKTDIFVPISIYLKNLETLKISKIPVVIPNIVRLESLTKLEIDKVESLEKTKNLTLIVLSCPKLKTLKVNKIVTFDVCKFLEEIKDVQTIEEIYLGTWLTLNEKKLLDVLCQLRNLKVLSFKKEKE